MDYFEIVTYAQKIVVGGAKKLWSGFSSMLFTAKQTRLEAELQRLEQRGVTIGVFFSVNDPGYEILMTEGRRVAKRMLKAGDIRVRFIEDADYTFTKLECRNQFVRAFVEHFTRQTVKRG